MGLGRRQGVMCEVRLCEIRNKADGCEFCLLRVIIIVAATSSIGIEKYPTSQDCT